ncbi:MAG TPA: hypothetical protein DCG75_17575 [Bacteroidales bacterium]|nr:hypothetical protein [Bacteroidales bacterium]
MLSFIIIGRNEGWKLTKCIESVLKSINQNSITDFEMIYIDSKSTDDSIERIKKFDSVKSFQITGEFNAAIARNIGVNESTGEILVFLDGDMELVPEFLAESFLLIKNNINYISGQIENYYYDKDWNFIKSEGLLKSNKLETYDITNGGAFIITKDLWLSVHGMKSKYDRSQDIDLAYRLVKKGYKIYRSSKTMVKHHTIQYNFNPGIKTELLNFRQLLFRGLLIRDHLFNFKILKRNLRINYTVFLLLASIIFVFIYLQAYVFIPYVIILGIRSASNFKTFKNVINVHFIDLLMKYLFRDITAILGLLFFFPGNKKIMYLSVS